MLKSKGKGKDVITPRATTRAASLAERASAMPVPMPHQVTSGEDLAVQPPATHSQCKIFLPGLDSGSGPDDTSDKSPHGDKPDTDADTAQQPPRGSSTPDFNEECNHVA
jgi:hypothetical protein